MELSREILKAMQAVRSCLKKEGVLVSLHQPGAVDFMIQSCARSSDKETRIAGLDLQKATQQPAKASLSASDFTSY